MTACEHGRQARKCEVCELIQAEAENKRLREMLHTICGAWWRLTDQHRIRAIDHPDDDAGHAEEAQTEHLMNLCDQVVDQYRATLQPAGSASSDSPRPRT